ncbi:MAG TPA: hypothetical protein VMS11_15280 [Solirubrobacterales bacterium]|nr:hypothetical protein [Solirubrobacterales bacterium]
MELDLASNKGDEALASPLRRISAEIEADRETLEDVLDRLGVSRDRVKPVGAWLLERLGRLKLNGHLRGYSPLSRLLELEGLAIGIAGKTELWRTLAGLDLDQRAGVEFDPLFARAEEQHSLVTALHQLAVAAIDGR